MIEEQALAFCKSCAPTLDLDKLVHDLEQSCAITFVDGFEAVPSEPSAKGGVVVMANRLVNLRFTHRFGAAHDERRANVQPISPGAIAADARPGILTSANSFVG
jgi:hypothetical protein